MSNPNISNEEMQKSFDIINKMGTYYDKKIVGQKHLKLALLTAFIANGHILLESVPGLGKTTAAKTLADAVSGSFSRVQCTPDILPSDIVGTQIYNSQTGTFETQLGPVYANFVLLDEINRSSSKTQSAMLECMEEKQVTIGGKLYKMPDVFLVMATQNPIEQEGTYLLSEAQQDRFLLKEKIEYPSAVEEFEILNRIEKNIFNDADLVVLLPGGTGTISEFFAYLEEVRSNDINKTLILYNEDHHFDSTINLIEDLVKRSFNSDSIYNYFKVVNSFEEFKNIIDEYNKKSFLKCPK